MSHAFPRPTDGALYAAAFGDIPERWPLPPAQDSVQRWLRAVTAGGQGRYGAARTELALLRREAPAGPLASLAHSTEASLWRQLGWHARARGWDGRALLLAGDDREARTDALVGLAADALGLGRFALSERLLQRARSEQPTAPVDRHAVRIAWVSAELAMAQGHPDAALDHAQRGVALAADGTSVRHRVKSDVVLAAALCCAGRVPEATALADGLLARTEAHGLTPLRWAVASLLLGIGSEVHTVEQVRLIRDTAADVVGQRGGAWCAR